MKTEIPLLADIRVASPCHASWDSMKGDERARFCGLCRKNVYNLSEMTRQEAEQLLREKEGRLCVRYYRRSDGTVLTKDCPIGATLIRRALLTRAVSASALLVTVIALFGKSLGSVSSLEMPLMGAPTPAPHETIEKIADAPMPEPTMGVVKIEIRESEPIMGDIATPAPEMGKVAIDVPKTKPKH